MYKYIVVNAFSRRPFAGANIAVMFESDIALDAEERQRVAGELGTAATAFVTTLGSGSADVKFHTPWEALASCTAGLLATAHAMWTEGRCGHGEAVRLRQGDLEAVLKKRADHLCLSATEAHPQELDEVPAELQAIGGKCYLGTTPDRQTTVIELESESLLADLAPPPVMPSRVLAATARSSSSHRDFVSRVFVKTPQGIREDAVHGGAHQALFPYWRDKLNAASLRAEQISHRGGVLHGEWDGEGALILSGQAVTTVKGILTVRP